MAQVVVGSPLFSRPRHDTRAHAPRRAEAAVAGPARGIMLAAAFSSLVWAALASLVL